MVDFLPYRERVLNLDYPSLIRFYDFNDRSGNIIDYSASGKNITTFALTLNNSNAPHGQRASYADGVLDYASLPSLSGEINLLEGTLFQIVKTPASTWTNGTIESFCYIDNTGTADVIGFRNHINNAISARVRIGGSFIPLLFGPFNSTAWIFFALTWFDNGSGLTFEFWADGVSLVSVITSSYFNPATVFNSGVICGRSGTGSETIVCDSSIFAMWNKKLNDNEISIISRI